MSVAVPTPYARAAGRRPEDDDPLSGFAVRIARQPLVATIGSTNNRDYATIVLCFTSVLWGALVSGGFFQRGLIVLGCLAAASAVAARAARTRVGWTPWLAWPSVTVVSAIVLGAWAAGDLIEAWVPIAAVVAAACLGFAGSSRAGLFERLLVWRAVADVALLVSIAGWCGVAFHISKFAMLQSSGWRANGGIGYANVTALLLLFGLLCMVACAAVSGARSDHVRACLIMTGILATQSRAVVAAAGLSWILLRIVDRVSARELARAATWAAIAFVGLVPSIQNSGARPGFALVGIGVAVTFAIATGDLPTQRTVTVLSLLLATGAGLTAAVLLRDRIADGGSNSGRLHLWQLGMDNLRRTGWFGVGPHQLAHFSAGHIDSLFTHSDPLQYVQYYGVFGAVALLVILWHLARALWVSRQRLPGVDLGLACTVTASLSACALIDFPLQVPVIPASAALILGSALGAASGRDERPAEPEAQRTHEQQTGRSEG